MTERLYYSDPSLHAFDATVASIERRDDRLIVTLDRTAFYPTSGGQPFDTGTLAGFRVVDVVDEDGGAIAHVLAPQASIENPESRTLNPEPGTLNPGQQVHGEIDWARRFDHMQQHTGQHVLSAAFDRLFGARTVSFHLGAAASTIDLTRELTSGEIAAAEIEANRVVWDNRVVTIRFATVDEAAKLPLRKRLRPARDASPRDGERERAGAAWSRSVGAGPHVSEKAPREPKESKPTRTGTLRLIDVEGFDLSACGGTHVARTGAIGVIAVTSWERFKGGQRVEFLCGGRALTRFRSVRDTIGAGVRLLSVTPEELPAAIERMQADAKDQKRAIVGLQAELARFRAEELAASAEQVRLKPDATRGADSTEQVRFRPDAATGEMTTRLVLRAVDGDAHALKTLAMTVAAKPGHLVVLVSTSRPALVVVTRSSDVPVNAQQILSSLTARFGGRGGGKPDLAQGGGLDAPPDAILAAAREVLLTRSAQR